MSPIPLALTPALPSELLSYILAHNTHPTTLIICQPRASFLCSLLASVPTPHTSSIEDEEEAPPADEEPLLRDPSDNDSTPPTIHPLLLPTLRQVAASRCVNLVFLPTVSHLRACLAVFGMDVESGQRDEALRSWDPNMQRKKVPLLVVYGLVELHRDTSEWSAQGIGNSTAAVVEAGWRTGRNVVLVEERNMTIEHRGVGDEGEEVRKLSKCWEERVPMLNGSVRRAGFESADGAWSGRTVEVGRILARWFKFCWGTWDNQE